MIQDFRRKAQMMFGMKRTKDEISFTVHKSGTDQQEDFNKPMTFNSCYCSILVLLLKASVLHETTNSWRTEGIRYSLAAF